MANELDEFAGPVLEEGRDVNVINKRIPVKTGAGSVVFEVFMWLLLIIPGLILQLTKTKARTYLRQLEQKLQHDASQIDNFLEQRVIVLQNTARLLDRAIEFDEQTLTKITSLRSGLGSANNDELRNDVSSSLDSFSRQLNIQVENYPDLKAHAEIRDAMQQNMYLQREITAAREVYNDTVYRWNAAIQEWPSKMMVASKLGYTTRIPFATSQETKAKAKEVFF